MEKFYRHILVPLDSSELAELALTDAISLAQMKQAQVTLLHVIPPIEDTLATDTGHPIYIDQQWDSHRMLAMEYLNEVKKRVVGDDVVVHTAVEMGPAAETIIDYANHHPIDVIVMATHGRSGLRRWVYGSVADKVLRAANVPVLLVRAYPERESMPAS